MTKQHEQMMPDVIWAKNPSRLDGGMYWLSEKSNLTSFTKTSTINAQLDSVIIELEKLRDTDCGDPNCMKEAGLNFQIIKLKSLRSE